MKLFLALSLVILFQMHANVGYAQDKISLDMKGASVFEVLEEIERTTDFRFHYKKIDINLSRKVTIRAKRKNIAAVLQVLFKDGAVNYEISDKNIILTSKRTETYNFPEPKSGLDMQQAVSGTVTDALGPITGVNVILHNQNTGTFTDREGQYRLMASPADTLVFTYLGYKTVKLPVGNRTQINVRLQEEATALQEVEVNAGYYTVKERERTGSISRVTAEEIEMQPVSNPLAAMQGRMAGVFITQNTGVPGGSFSIQIRGRNSIASGNDPLYIVNGVPLTTSISSYIGNLITNGGNPLNGIDLSDVESIEVLKDADATAIYGSRGANGVVLITTKKGNVGKTRFDMDIQTGVGSVANKLDLLNSKQYVMMRKEAFLNDGVEPTIANARDLLLWDTSRYTDWQEDLIGGTAYLTNFQGAVSGGHELTSFRLGGALREETTVFPGNFKYQKASGHIQLNHFSEDKRFSVSFSGNYVSEVNHLLNQDITSFIFMPPVTPVVFSEDGRLNWGPEGGTFNNPYATLYKKYNVKTDNLVSNLDLSYKLVEGLKAKMTTGYTTINSREVQTTPSTAINPAFLLFFKAESYFNYSLNKSWLVEPQIDYKLDVGKHSFNALIGATFQQNTIEGQYTAATDFASDLLLENVGAAATIRSSSTYSDYKYQAIFGRLNYNYNDRYILNVTGRRDGSSRFGPGNRFANFGAVGTAWLFSNEDFVKKTMSFLSFGKLRGSYGITGNDQIGDYRYLDSYSATLYPYQGISGLYPTRIFNPNYGWEENKKMEAAMELGFVHDKIWLSATWYRNHSSSQLVGYPLPSTTGFSTIQYNLAAKVENTGIELDLKTVNINTSVFKWSTNINITFLDNTLLEYPDLEDSSYANEYEVGKSLSLMRSYRFLDVNPQSGIYEFEDVDSDGTINYPNDLQSLVDLDPDFYGGLGSTVSYNGFNLDMFFQFVKQQGYNPLFLNGNIPGRQGNQLTTVLNRWQQPGDNTNVQRFTQNSSSPGYLAFNQSRSYGDNQFSDASFVRLKTIALSYQIPEHLIKDFKTTIYLQGQNLFTITGYDGLDPETNSSLRLPPLRMLTVGVHITF